MGIVYQAEDLHLGRTVALKFLPPHLTADPDAKTRFVGEARAASALDHPALCTIHEIGETDDGHIFIAMACYEGETLKERLKGGALPAEQAVGIVRRLAEGLAEAHARDIVHRDVKPANIFLCGNGQVKLLDFGVAKLVGGSQRTQAGQMVGTVEYMAPEQLAGDQADHRADIWALGVVLREMISGRSPFAADYLQAAMYQVMHQEPEPLAGTIDGVTPELDRIMVRMLAKAADDRYARMDDLLADLDGVTPAGAAPMGRPLRRAAVAGAAVLLAAAAAAWLVLGPNDEAQASRPSVAVLPCVDREETAESTWFSEGITDDLIMVLAGMGSLRVINPMSVQEYKDTDKPLARIAEELGVDLLLRSTVAQHGDSLRFVAQLIAAESGEVVWSNRYEQGIRDISRLWGTVAAEVAAALDTDPTPVEMARLTRSRPVEPEAYRAYQQGRQAWKLGGLEECLTAIGEFEAAVAIDPGFALGFTGLADAHTTFGEPALHMGRGTYADHLVIYERHMALAREAVEQALALDPELPEAHATRAVLLRWTDPVEAEREFRVALASKPNMASAHYYYANLLKVHGRLDEAWEHAEIATSLEPTVHRFKQIQPHVLMQRGELAAADRALAALAEQSAGTTIRAGYLIERAWLLLRLKRFEEARSCLLTYAELKGLPPDLGVAVVEYVAGNMTPEQFDPIAENIARNFGPVFVAGIQAGAGDFDRAMDYLERSYAMGDFLLVRLGRTHVMLQVLGTDPRYLDLLQRIGLPPPTPLPG